MGDVLALPGACLPELDLLGDVGGEFDDADRFTIEAQKRIVGRLDPDFAPILAQTPVSPRMMLTPLQNGPELGVGRLSTLGWVDEHAVMPALDLIQAIAQPARKLLFAVTMVPSSWNSITACERSIE